MVNWTADGKPGFVQDVRINHGGGDIFVAQKLLHGSDVVAALQEVGREAVSKRMAAGWFVQPGGANRKLDRILHVLLPEVMTARFAAPWISRKARGGKDVLPGPGSGRARIFPLQGMREVNCSATQRQILAVQLANASEVSLKWGFESLGQQGNAVALSFAFANGDLVIAKVYVFHPQAQRFEQSQATPIKKMADKAIVSTQVREHGTRFCPGKDNRQAGRPPDALRIDKIEFPIEHLLVKEEQSTESLILGGGGDGPIDRKMIEEGSNLRFAHLVRMAFPME